MAFALRFAARLSLCDFTTRQASLHATDRPVAPPIGLLTLGFDAGRFPPTPPVCYRASWQLPGPDLHRQAMTSLRSKDQLQHQPHLRSTGRTAEKLEVKVPAAKPSLSPITRQDPRPQVTSNALWETHGGRVAADEPVP